MAEQLIVRFTTPSGKPAQPVTAFTTNTRNFPFFSEWRSLGGDEIAIRYPKEQPFALSVLWEIPGFGRVIVTADNEGRFYRLGGPRVDFRAEAAKTKMSRVLNRLHANAASTVPDGLRRSIEAADARLKRALSNPNATRELDSVLCDLFFADEQLELIAARTRIAAMDADVRRSKLFGSAFFDTDASDTFLFRFQELFNFATTPFYRRRVEPVEGQPDWQTRDRLLDTLDDWAMPRKGHPLSWWIEHGLTDWMKKLSYRTLKEVVYQQVFDTVTRYRDRIKIWDVINEAHDPIVKGNDLNLDTDQVFEITALACDATRAADPDAVRIVNVNRPWGEYRAEWESMNPMHAIEYVEGLSERGIEYDVLGLQMYHGGPEHYVRDMTEQSALIESYLALGKPVHISEVQTPSSMEADPSRWLGGQIAPSGWWHRPWDPDVQADWVEQYYTIAASKPGLDAITWWNLGDRRTFWPHGGLLDENEQPKPAYHRLRDFIRAFRGE